MTPSRFIKAILHAVIPGVVIWMLLCWTASAFATVALVSGTPANTILTNSVSSQTWSYNAGSNTSNTILIITVAYTAAGGTISGITYAGVSAVQAVGSPAIDGGVVMASGVWYVLSPATGANNMVIHWSPVALQEGTIGAVVFSGVAQTTPLGTHSTLGNGTLGNFSTTVTVPTNGGAIDSASTGMTMTSPTQTQLYISGVSGNAYGASQYSLTGGTRTFGWNSIRVDLIYPINPYTTALAAPTLSVAGGTYNNNQIEGITCAVGTGCYNLIGTATATTPGTCDQNTYSSPFSITATGTTVSAICTEVGQTNSSATGATFTLTAATPVPSLSAGSYLPGTLLSLNSASAGASIYYTTNGSTPSCPSTGTLYSSPLTLTPVSTITVKAIACNTNYNASGVLDNVYTVRNAETFYVSNAGSDSANGTSTSTPWQTIAQVNTQTFVPGDSILFNQGNTFLGMLVLAQSGTAGSSITIGAYGSGAQPIINPATVLSSWSLVGSGVYSENISGLGLGTIPNMVFEDTIPLQAATSAACSNGQWFYAYPLMYYKPSSGTPASHTVGLVQPSYISTPYNNGISLNNQSYVTVNNIEVIDAYYGVSAYEVSAQTNNLTVQNCSFYYNFAGTQIWTLTGSSNGNISNNYFNRCSQGPTFEVISAGIASFTSWVVNQNTLINTGTIDGTIQWSTIIGGAYDQEGIGLQDAVNCTISQNVITGGNQYPVVIYNNSGATSSGNVISRNLISGVGGGDSVMILDGYHASYAFNNNQIVYNLIINNGIEGIQFFQGSASTQQNLIANNVFYGNTGDPLIIGNSSYPYSIYTTVKNNIFYNNSGFYSGPYNYAVPDATFICDYNLYGPSAPNFGSSNTSKTLAQWQALGYDTHGIGSANPRFVNASGSYSLATDFMLWPSSPAIGTGVAVGLTTDYIGLPLKTPPDIGAYQFDAGFDF